MYFFMNSKIQLILFVLSTDHFFFFIMGASPAGLSRTSTETKGEVNVILITKTSLFKYIENFTTKN